MSGDGDEEEEDENYGKGPPPMGSGTAATVTQGEYAPRDGGATEQVSLDADFGGDSDEDESEDAESGESSDIGMGDDEEFVFGEEEEEELEELLSESEAELDIAADGESSTETLDDGGDDFEVPEATDDVPPPSERNMPDLEDDFYRTDLTPDAPDGANVDDAVEFREVGEEAAEVGVSEDSMLVGVTDDGDRMFVTRDEFGVAGDTMDANATVSHLKDAIDDESITETIPAINVDNEREVSVLEAVGGDDAMSLQKRREESDGDVAIDEESYRNAIGVKTLAGDTDYAGNVVVGEDGTCHPIDFDLAGQDIESIGETANKYSDDYDSAWEKMHEHDNFGVRDQTEGYDSLDTDGEYIRESAERVAQAIDAEQLDDALRRDDNVGVRTRQAVVSNVELLQGGD